MYMEVSMFNDLGMNDPSLFQHQQLQVNSLEELFGPSQLPAYSYGSSFDQAAQITQSLTRKRFAQSDVHDTLFEKPIKQHKTNNWDSYDQINRLLNSQDHLDSNSTMLSFSSSSNSSSQTSTLVTPKEEVAVSNITFPSPQHEMVVDQASFDKQGCKFEVHRPQVAKKTGNNFASIPQQSMDHILAERKRREKLSQRFIALSAIIPGLKKMDKASVLGDAIKYVKQMQEKVQTLEEEAKKKPVESAVLVKRSYVSADNDNFSAETSLSSGGSSERQFPEIEVRLSDKDVLISIHCEKKKGVVEKVVSQIEDFHLVVISSSSLAFGSSALAVTIIAQMDAEFSMTGNDLIRQIHTTLKCLM